MEYAAALEQFGFRPVARGPWAVVGRTKREQGWKLHVSTIPVEAPALLDTIMPLLRRTGVSFKLARDESLLRQLNEGSFGATQIGKFLTIYPATNRSARDLAVTLLPLTQDFSGPVIVTDLRLGNVVYARYGPFSPRVLRDRLGHVSIALRLPNGDLVPHEYSVPFESPRGRVNPFRGLAPYRRSGSGPKASGLFGPGYLILDVLHPNARGSVFLALDARAGNERASLRVLKEGRQHCCSDGLGRDMRSRLRHQAAISQLLFGKISVPAADPYFEVAGNGYLPLEYVHGADLAHDVRGPLGTLERGDRRRILDRLIQLSQIIAALHAEGYVHRDVKPSNFRVTPNGHLCMIDLELAYQLGSSEAPFGKGTPGFMSQQQEAEEQPSIADDVFGIGSVALYLLTGIHPLRLAFSDRPVTGSQLAELAQGSWDLMEVVARCLSVLPDSRPSLSEITLALTLAADALDQRSTAAPRRPHRSQLRSSAQSLLPLAAEGLLHDVCLDGQLRMWLSQSPEQNGSKALIAPDYRFYRSANRGVAGVIYGLARLARNGYLANGVSQRSCDAIDWLLAHHDTPDDQLPGLHFGEAGVAVAIAEAIRSGVIERGAWLDEYLSQALCGPLDWPDLTHGAAGQGIAAMCCADALDDPSLISAARRCAELLVSSQDNDGGWTMPPGAEGLSGARLTGFAHGVAGIVYFLAEYSARCADLAAKNAALHGADWLMERARTSRDGRTVQWPTREGGEDIWRWWCHGAPGIALAWLKLFERFGDPDHEAVASRALRCHPVEVRYSNLSVCHGLSGLGEIYLEAARVLQGREWSMRAERVGNVLVQLARPAGSGVVWLVEDGLIPTADLMVGCAGVAHFLLRLSADDRPTFPLLP